MVANRIASCAALGAAVLLTACQPGGGSTDAPAAQTAPHTAPQTANEPAPPVSVLLVDGGRSDWTMQITRDASYSAFAFVRAGADWRSAGYASQTPGVRVERVGGFDTILFDDGAPDVATFTFQPYSGQVQATYTPRIPFSDGGDAVFLGAFVLMALENRDAVIALDGESGNYDWPAGRSGIALRSERPILFRGQVHDGGIDATDRASSYAYLGEAEITTGNSFKGVVDPGLPDFLRDGFDADLLRIFGALDQRFGAPLGEPASLLLAFRGLEEDGLVLNGGVLPDNAMAIEIGGDVLASENPRIQPYLQRFFAHEATHLYQNARRVRYSHRRHAWIGEGAAEAMALQIAVELGLADEAVRLEQYAENYALCDSALRGRTLDDAIRRGPEGNYDCGDLLALFADAAIGEHDLSDLWMAMEAQAAARGDTDPNGDVRYTADDHFSAMERLGADPALVARMRRFASEPVADPLAELRAMSEAVGIEAAFEDGALVSFEVPDTAR